MCPPWSACVGQRVRAFRRHPWFRSASGPTGPAAISWPRVRWVLGGRSHARRTTRSGPDQAAGPLCPGLLLAGALLGIVVEVVSRDGVRPGESLLDLAHPLFVEDHHDA